ncbi:MAG: hypothetical protein QOE86_2346 [Solirubrobacteraceae bacterium]|nr:hypothetical protein [Solirubrobacteraceae bacterium]MEA2294707.1 hypothetical protein [Solirubrobacteraceae bacterium]
MPFLEVIHASGDSLSVDARRAFAEEAVAVFADVVGTPPGRLRLCFDRRDPLDTIEGLLGERARGDRD